MLSDAKASMCVFNTLAGVSVGQLHQVLHSSMQLLLSLASSAASECIQHTAVSAWLQELVAVYGCWAGAAAAAAWQLNKCCRLLLLALHQVTVSTGGSHLGKQLTV